MGTGETGAPPKAAKVSVTQDQQVSPTPYPEWAAAFQAYYNSGGQAPHGYFPPSVASGPPPHPYMWGAQPLMPPYGTPPPPPYGAVYPHGAIYSHAAMAPYGLPTSGASEGTPVRPQPPTTGEADGSKVLESNKDRTSTKRAKGSLGLSVSDAAKGSPVPSNDVFSQSSGESVSEGSSEASEDDSSQNVVRKRYFGQAALDGGEEPSRAEAAGSTRLSASALHTPNLSVGIQDYWSASGHGSLKNEKRTSASTSSGLVHPTLSTPAVSRDGGVPAELWLQDEREVKRQRRKQSNRESARRSRLRKQAECEELGTRVDTLTVENMALRTELTRLSEECKKLTAENTSLVDQLQRSKGGLDGAPLNLATVTQDALQPVQTVQVPDASKAASPRRQGVRQDEGVSCDSTGKLSPALELGSHPESVAAG